MKPKGNLLIDFIARATGPLIIINILLAGCFHVEGETPTNTNDAIPELPSITETRPAVTNTPECPATSTPEPVLSLAYYCPQIANATFPEIGLLASGKIIFLEYRWESPPMGETDDRLYSFSSQEMVLFPFFSDLETGSLGDFDTSSDNSWLSFRQERREGQDRVHSLIITTSNDENRIVLPWDEENWGYSIRGWLADRQRLMIVPREGQDDEIILFNPFTGNQERLLPTFTYPEDSYRLKDWGLIGLSVVYDPTMTRVIYMEDDRTMVLWDLEEHKQLWWFEEPVLMRKEIPTWSPNGEYLAVFDLFGENNHYPDEGDEFQVLLVHRSGEVVWRSEHYPFFDRYYNSMYFNWSPNGEYLVFDWVLDEEGNHHTFILNVDSQELSEYCFRGSVPVWSPDSRQFIMKLGPSDPISEEWDNSGNVIVDVESGEIYLLDDIKYWPKAWLITEEAE